MCPLIIIIWWLTVFSVITSLWVAVYDMGASLKEGTINVSLYLK